MYILRQQEISKEFSISFVAGAGLGGRRRNDVEELGGVRWKVRSGYPCEGHQGPRSDPLKLLQLKTLLSYEKYPLPSFPWLGTITHPHRLRAVTPPPPKKQLIWKKKPQDWL